MIAAIVPQFFTADMTATLDYYEKKLGFEKQFEYGEPAFYGGVIRDGLSIFFRHLDEVPPLPEHKYSHELLDAYIRVEDAQALHADYERQGLTISRPIADMEWGFREFVVRDIDGRLLCFGQALEDAENAS